MSEKCAVCGDDLRSHYRKVLDPLTHELFAIFRCRRCGLGQTVPQPHDLAPYYSTSYYGNRHGFTLRHCIKRRLRFVDTAIHGGTGKRLLDIGCGDGSFLLAARQAGWETMGTELNPQPAREAGLDIKEAIEQIPSTDQFDCITMWHTLEHMRNIPFTVTQLARLLKPEGRLIIAVPDFGGLQANIFRERWLHLDVPRHLYHFDADALQHCLALAGVSVQRQWHQEFEYDLLGWSQSALNYILPYQNIFFDCITGKRKNYSRFVTMVSFILGALLTALALPAVPVGTLLRRGGTLVTVARHKSPSTADSYNIWTKSC